VIERTTGTIGFLEQGERSLALLELTGATEAVRKALLRYVLDGARTGDFLRALLSNDLQKTFGLADMVNVLSIHALVQWLYNEAPSPCWGSPEKVEAWLARRRG